LLEKIDATGAQAFAICLLHPMPTPNMSDAYAAP
jgi:hypothetical protein